MLSGVRLLLVGAAFLLAACDARSGRIPAYDDMDGLRAVAFSLSPWTDGSPDKSNDGLTSGRPGSDRKVFQDWADRYRFNETYAQHRRDYQPFPVPGSVGEALAEQRAFEGEEARRATAARALEARRRAQQAAKLEQRIAEQTRAQKAAEERERRRIDDIMARSAREGMRALVADKERDVCRHNRIEAAYAAGATEAEARRSSSACDKPR